MSDESHVRFKRWLWRPPRAHGEIISDRTVSFVELFYDLVYVAVIAQAVHHLAGHVSLRSFAEFAVVFALIWIAWVNGSLYLEIHGREDGRTRNVVFVQMGVLVLLAVFTTGAADASGRGFALVYASFLAVLTWLWDSVRRQDRRHRRWPQELSPPSSSACCDRLRGSWACCLLRSFRCCGSSPSAASCGPTPGATKGRTRRDAQTPSRAT